MIREGYEKKACRGKLPWEISYKGETVARFLVESLADDVISLLRGEAMVMRMPGGAPDESEEKEAK